MKHLSTALLVCLALAACAPSASTRKATGEDLAQIVRAERGKPGPATPACEKPADLIGKPHSVLATMKFRVPIRVIFPGTPVSGDQISNRLNFKVDKKGIIQDITCG